MNSEMIDFQKETRRDRRISASRKKIMDVAATLIAERGYEATTTKDISDAADIGESTLYGYFASKQDILNAILNEQAKVVDDLLLHMNELTTRKSFVDLIVTLVEKMHSISIYSRVVVSEAWVNNEVMYAFIINRWRPVMDTLIKFITEKQKEGLIKPMDVNLTARIMMATFVGSVIPILRGIEPLSSIETRRQLAESIVNVIYDGIGTGKVF
jgi:AcrR family transcriptional regulator